MSEPDFEETLRTLQQHELLVEAIGPAILVVGKHHDPIRIQRSKAVIAGFLDHPDAWVRHEALFCLGLWWAFPEFEDKFKDMLLQDPDELVRSTAAHCLGVLKRGAKDVSILSFLARVVLRQDEDPSVRSVAYGAMLMVAEPSNPKKATRFLSYMEGIEKIDLQWVRSFVV